MREKDKQREIIIQLQATSTDLPLQMFSDALALNHGFGSSAYVGWLSPLEVSL